MQPFENFQKHFFKQQFPKSKLCCLFCSFKAGTDKMGTVYVPNVKKAKAKEMSQSRKITLYYEVTEISSCQSFC
jgi:hypothetical protein